MLNAEVLDTLQDLGINTGGIVALERRSDPMDIGAGKHIAAQGEINLYRAGEVVIKTGPEHKYGAYLKEHRLSEYMAQHGISAPISVTTPLKVGGYAIQLTLHIEHDRTATPPPETTGLHLAALHLLPAPDWLSVSQELYEKSQLLLTRADILGDVKELIRNNCQPIDELVSSTNSTAHRLCHGDLHLGNILPQPQGVRLIDFEAAASGHPLWDMARLAQAADKFGLNQDWYERCWQAWSEIMQFDTEQLAPFVEWRSWYGVIDLLGRSALNQTEQAELAVRLNWARDGTPHKWSRA